jgi:aminopeptidase N
MIAPDGTFTLERTADVSYQGQTTEVSAFHHRACPDFVMPNQDDHDYALFSLDPVSQTHAAKAVAGGIKDSLVRLQLWSIMGQMVRDRELTPASLMDIALVGLEAEREDLLLGILLKSYSPISSSYFHYFTPQQRQKFAPAFEAMLWRRIVNAAPGSGEQLNFFDYYVSVAQTDEAVAALYNMFEKNSPPSGIELGPNRRWAIINKLSSFKHPEALNLISTEEKRDTTTMGERFAYGGKIAFPTIENKKKYWEEFKNVAAIGANKFQSGANYFHSIHQQELAAMFADDFFNRAKTIDWEKEEELIEPYFESLFPAQLCNLALLKRSQSEINRAKNLTSLSRRAWLEANDELERCVKIRQTLTSKNK